MSDSSYKHILVALDIFSEYTPILRKALSLCSDKSKLALVHVTIPHAYFEPYAIDIGRDFTFEIQQKAETKLKEIASQNTIEQQNVYARIGNAADEIHELAEELNSDLIVIGTHGQSGLRLLLGSTANAVLHGAKCDVLAVKI